MPTEVLIDKLKIKLAGAELSEEQNDLVRSVTLDSSLHVPDMFEINLAEMKMDELEALPFAVGKEIEISMSDESDSITSILKGDITGLEPVFSSNLVGMIVRGYDKAYKMHRGTKTKTWPNIKDSDIASQIASANGLQAEVDATTEVFKHVFQTSQSDFDFLVSRAERIGYTVFTENGKLKFLKGKAPSSADKTLTMGQNLISFRPRLSMSDQVTEVTVKGWDPKNKQAFVGTASSSSVSPSVGFGQSGTQAAGQIGAAPRLAARQNVASQDDATTYAQGLLDRSNESFIQADGEAEGVPDLHAGMVVQIDGAGSKFSGKYRLTSVRHEYRQGVYETSFQIAGSHPTHFADLVGGGSSSGGSEKWGGVYVAIVTNNNAEDDFGQVKVKYPWMDDSQESFWARIAGPGGGKQRGLYFLPEVDDEVLVAFEQGDFNHPYIIGGLYNGKDAPPLAVGDVVSGGKVKQRVIKTRTGHSMTFWDDDAGKEYIEIKDAKGNTQMTFDTTNKKIILESKGEVEIKSTSHISMKSESGNITIEASSGNVEIKGIKFSANGQSSAEMVTNGQGKVDATGTLSLHATGMTELKSDAILTLQGSLVKIN